MKKFLFIVISDKPQAGKTTVANYIAELTGGVRISTSDAILPRIAEKVGLTVDEIKTRRKPNPDFLRAELITEGDKMRDENYPPGIACLDMVNGYNFIALDGIRRATELIATKRSAKQKGYRAIVIYVIRKDNNTEQDNTELGLQSMAHYWIFNKSDLITLKGKVKKTLQEIDVVANSRVKSL